MLYLRHVTGEDLFYKCIPLSYTINLTFNDIDARTALVEKGFDVLTEIDVKATMKKKLDLRC
jgi:uncharacterized protein (DUF302 family)